MSVLTNSRCWTLVPDLAFADLRHEWILTLCLVLAIAAVVAPLLLLLGLKHGVIATLRGRLIQDPVYREIRPAETREYSSGWFESLRRRRAVAFIIPTILPASSIVTVVRPQSGGTKIIDLIPTAPGDPLILENGGRIPGPDQCVLTEAAARDLGVRTGATLRLKVTRSVGGRMEAGLAALEVAAVLTPRAGTLPRLYAPLRFVVDVESYKEGMAVPARAWSGGMPRPYYSFDGFLVVLPEKLDPVSTSGLIINTGLNSIESIDSVAFRKRTGFRLPEHLVAYYLGAEPNNVQLASFEALREKLRGSGEIVLPYVRPMTVHLEGVTPRDVSLSGLSLSPSQAKVLSVPEVPWGGFDDQELATSYDRWGQILLPAHAEAKAGRLLRASTLAAGETLHFPLRDRGESFADYALAPAELLAALRTARQRKVRFDEAQKMFVMAHAGFRGFRLYARGIDDVAPLADAMQKEGIPVITQADAIERIRILDRGLTNVFWLVAVVGIVGGIAALIASLYASVERKKRDLGVMRLIGLTRTAVFQFPVYQGAGIAVMSMVAAAAAYFLLARIINLIFSGDLELGQEICSLPTGYLGIAAAWTLSFAVLSSLLAAWRATQIDPAEAVREE